jgi:ketosteroid isomerase-like protein
VTLKFRTTWTLALLLTAGTTAARGGDGAAGAENNGAATRSQDEAALRALDLAWSEAAARKDLDATVSYMADDGETLAPNEPLASGKAAIRASWENLLALPNLVIGWQPVRVDVAASGDLAYTRGTYTLSFTDPAGKTVTDRGKYLEVWRKAGGKWKCVADAFNTDLPLP